MIEETQYRADVIVLEKDVHEANGSKDLSADTVGLLRKLIREARTIALVTLVIFAVAVAAAFLIPPLYTSTASLVPPASNNSSGAAALAGQLSQLSGLGAGSLLGSVKSPSDLYVGILKSRSIAAELVKRFDLMKVYGVKRESRAEKKLASRSVFEVGIKDSIVTIGVSDTNPDRARALANGYLDALRGINGRLALSESSQRRVFFGQQLAQEKDDLENVEVALKETEEKSGLIAPAGQTATKIQVVAQTRAQIAVRQVELAALRQSATEQNSEVVRLQSEIADLHEQLSRLQSGNGEQADADIPTSKVPQLELEYVRRQREVKYHEALFEMLARQYEAARIDEAHEAPLLQVLDAASYPDSKSWPPRILILVGGLILGVLAGCCLVVLRERFVEIRAALLAQEAGSNRMSS